MPALSALPATYLPAGIRARFVDGINGLRLHILEAGYETPGRPLVLLLHGFPELAYSWRKVMTPLAAAGFHVVAPDQRGYGRTTGWSDAYDQDLRPFTMPRLAADAVALVYALGFRTAAVVGHDFGSPVAGWCALTRPDIFRSVVMMSAPFGGPPSLPTSDPPPPDAVAAIEPALAALSPSRKHYQAYYAAREANADMMSGAQGLHDFLRAYFHHKSADWPENRPYRLAGWTAEEAAKMPTYYIMDLDRTMAETVAPFMPSPDQITACAWLPEAEMRVYSEEYGRTSFQGGLNWYRVRFDPDLDRDLLLYANRTIDQPSMFIAGQSDWGIYQFPGAIERMQEKLCTHMVGCHLVDGAGHWVMQEKPQAVLDLLVPFLRAHTA